MNIHPTAGDGPTPWAIHPVMVLVSVLIGLKLQGGRWRHLLPYRSRGHSPRSSSSTSNARPTVARGDVASRAARRGPRHVKAVSVRVPTAPVVVPGSPADAASLSVSGGAAAVAPTTARGGLTGGASRFRPTWWDGLGEPGDADRRQPGVTGEAPPPDEPQEARIPRRTAPGGDGLRDSSRLERRALDRGPWRAPRCRRPETAATTCDHP